MCEEKLVDWLDQLSNSTELVLLLLRLLKNHDFLTDIWRTYNRIEKSGWRKVESAKDACKKTPFRIKLFMLTHQMAANAGDSDLAVCRGEACARSSAG